MNANCPLFERLCRKHNATHAEPGDCPLCEEDVAFNQHQAKYADIREGLMERRRRQVAFENARRERGQADAS